MSFFRQYAIVDVHVLLTAVKILSASRKFFSAVTGQQHDA